MDKAAQQLFTVLGELKGGAMKVGQALSVMEAAIPEEYGRPYREALTKLQREAPPLPAAKVHRVLDGQLGTKWRERFTSFEDKPVASASIGQVHKAVWSDGRDVAVKIQYPGADEALRADLKTMQRMVKVLKQLSPAPTFKPWSTNSSNAPRWNWTTGWRPTTSVRSRKPMRDIRISSSRTSWPARRRWSSRSGSRASRCRSSSARAPRSSGI